MKRRKQKRDWKRVGSELLAFALFVFLIFIIIDNLQENEDIKLGLEMNAVTATIYDKTAEKHLFSGMSYMVLLQPGLVEKTKWQIPPGYRAGVSKSEFEMLEVGDTIDGHSVEGVFYTPSELKYEDRSLYIVLFLVGIYPLGYICYLLFKIKKFEEFVDRHDFGVGVIMYTVFWGGLLVFLLFMYRDMAADLKNGYEKFYGKDYIETVATITDHHSYSGTGRDYQQYYYLALTYQDESGERFNLTKEVRRNTYRNYVDGELPINYKKDNPYNAFAQKTEKRDVFNFLTSQEMFMHFLIIFITVLLSYALFLMNRKRRTGSYWTKTDKNRRDV
ncbi:hypothetical protein FQ087_00595 [Sporosarcina sp. ANT_H38]|uniref:hypothetical protein n=1 Tax=Sporosarcina sp. ANT_H38 TaxID=2597358 RepID=UPI0011F38827|nr:hypothetical protein [Sporosarcina sp. ANT_H38]KAA0964863.1 hypothetical protein FQ087_00595 [Sporosarcina sp. ANT_H38]